MLDLTKLNSCAAHAFFCWKAKICPALNILSIYAQGSSSSVRRNKKEDQNTASLVTQVVTEI